MRNVFYTGGPVTIEAIVQCESSSDGGFSGRQTLLSNETDRAGLAIGCEWNNWFFSLQSIDAVKQVVEAARRGRNGATSAGRETNARTSFGRFAARPMDPRRRRVRRAEDAAVRRRTPPVNLQRRRTTQSQSAAADLGREGCRGRREGGRGRVPGNGPGGADFQSPAVQRGLFAPGGLAGGPAKAIVFKFTEGHGDQIHDIANKKIFGEVHGAEWVRLDASGRE